MKISKSNNSFLEFVYDFYNGMQLNEIMLAYEGDVTHQIMKSFTDLALGKMSKDEENEQTRSKVYHVMVECLQNIAKHAFHSFEENTINHSILLVTKSDQNYQIITGNIVKESKKEFLTDLLNRINRMDKKSLDQLYKKQLKEGHLSEKGGAGVGFIDIKRKTQNNLEYHFFPVNDTYSFFLFTSLIDRKI